MRNTRVMEGASFQKHQLSQMLNVKLIYPCQNVFAYYLDGNSVLDSFNRVG